MKKISLVLFVMFLTILKVQAAGVGYIDYPKVVENHPLTPKYKQEIQNKANSIKSYAKQQDALYKKETDKTKKETIQKSAQKQILLKEQEYLNLRTAREKEIQTKIRQVTEKIRVQKQLDVILNKGSIVAGGVDCTQDVINGLK